MIKGVNRHIIEITETGNIYYERALLVLRPEYAAVQREVLEREARRLIKGLKAPSTIKKRRAVAFWVLRLGMTAVISAVCTLLIYNGFFLN